MMKTYITILDFDSKHYIFDYKSYRLVEVSETDYMNLIGDNICRSYANSLYSGEITIADVPEERRKTVQSIVNNKIARWGKYEDLKASDREVHTLAKSLPGGELTHATAKTLFADIEKLRSGSTDAVASTAVSVFQKLKEDGSLIKAGTRINWNGTLKRAAVDLWDTADNNPDNAPALWEDINYRDGYRIIPETITVGLAFGLGECGWWGETLYRSKLAANVYTPAQYPDGWEIVNLILKEE